MHQTDRQSMHKRRSQRLIEAKAPKKRLRCPNGSSYSTISTLPTEILLLVIKYLPPPWTFSLALTCKYFTQLTYMSTLSRLEEKDLIEFLTTLQKDTPNMYFCYCCNKLRLVDPNLDWKSQTHVAIDCKSQDHDKVFWNSHWSPEPNKDIHISLRRCFSPIMLDISFMEVHLIMNRHLYGFSHGISLQSLERYESFEDVLEIGKCVRYRNYYRRRRNNRVVRDAIGDTETQLPGESLEAIPRKENAWRFSFRSTPKIIENKLFIARFYTIIGPLVPEEHLKKLIQTISIPICSHLTCSANPSCCNLMSSLPKRYLRCYPYIRSIVPYHNDDGKTIEFDPTQDSCLLCSTDYDISLSQETSNNETNLNVSTYHCLGSCRSPSDKLWDYFVNPRPCFSSYTNSTQYFASEEQWFVGEDGLWFPFDFPEQSFASEDHGSQFQELKSRVPELDHGGTRRKWHEAT